MSGSSLSWWLLWITGTELSCPIFGKSHKLVNFTTKTLQTPLFNGCPRWSRLNHLVTQFRYLSQVPPSRPLSSWELGFRALPPWPSSTKAGRNSTSSCRTPSSRPPRALTRRSWADRQTSVPPPRSSSVLPLARLNGCRSHLCPPSLAPQLRWFTLFLTLSITSKISIKEKYTTNFFFIQTISAPFKIPKTQASCNLMALADSPMPTRTLAEARELCAHHCSPYHTGRPAAPEGSRTFGRYGPDSFPLDLPAVCDLSNLRVALTPLSDVTAVWRG